jgi:pyruvate formate lyase activating enzyme
VGCNFECKFCQNWATSQVGPEEVTSMDFPAAQVVRRARDMGARSIAYSYVEPTVFIEFMMETAAAAKKAGLKNIYHSNGFINVKPLRDLIPFLDAANIDLKGFTDDFYRRLCGGQLAPVLRTIKVLREEGVHLEITNMVIPTQNDNLDLIRQMCLWIKNEIGPEVPVHFSRFYPLYKLKALPSTPVSTLDAIREVARQAGLRHVYIGNIPGHVGENTFCPQCERMIIRRTGFMVGEISLVNGQCRHCNRPIHGVWQ